jgi:hypothetical protein
MNHKATAHIPRLESINHNLPTTDTGLQSRSYERLLTAQLSMYQARHQAHGCQEAATEHLLPPKDLYLGLCCQSPMQAVMLCSLYFPALMDRVLASRC